MFSNFDMTFFWDNDILNRQEDTLTTATIGVKNSKDTFVNEVKQCGHYSSEN